MKIYMDVCCLCRPFDDRTQDRIRMESEAVLTILDRCNEDWMLVGSGAVDFEISAVTDQKKRTDISVLASLVKEKIKTDKRIIKRASELEELGFHAMDAAHISYAERGAEVMLTTDDDVLRMARIKRNQIYTEEIRRLGIDALAEALGPVDAVRFMQSFDLGRGDYTKERSHVLDLTLDEIFAGIEKRKRMISDNDTLV